VPRSIGVGCVGSVLWLPGSLDDVTVRTRHLTGRHRHSAWPDVLRSRSRSRKTGATVADPLPESPSGPSIRKYGPNAISAQSNVTTCTKALRRLRSRRAMALAATTESQSGRRRSRSLPADLRPEKWGETREAKSRLRFRGGPIKQECGEIRALPARRAFTCWCVRPRRQSWWLPAWTT
jgi:hypothetical protein